MAREQALVNSEEYILFKAKPGLLDLKLRIIDVSDASEELAWKNMTEVADGLYRYAHTFTSTGTYEVTFKSSSARIKTSVVYEVGGVISTAQSAASYYCDATDVARIMRITRDGSRLTFSGSTDPTLAEVNKFIEEASDRIDKITRHAWRTVTVTDEYYEYHPQKYGWGRWRGYDSERCIHLNHRTIHSFTEGTHKLELWNGSEWEDLIAGYTEGRDNDYWLDYDRGILYFISKVPSRVKNALKATYAFGESAVPTDIRNLCAKLVALDLYLSADYTSLVSEGEYSTPIDRKIEVLQKDIKELLDQYTEVTVL